MRLKYPVICLINGPPASGKSTVATALKNYGIVNTLHIPVDEIRSSLSESVDFNTKEGEGLLIKSTILAVGQAKQYIRSNNNPLIIIDDCIVDFFRLDLYLQLLEQYMAFTVCLWPTQGVQLLRNGQRASELISSELALSLRLQMEKSQVIENHNLIVDNSTKTLEQTLKPLISMVEKHLL